MLRRVISGNVKKKVSYQEDFLTPQKKKEKKKNTKDDKIAGPDLLFRPI